MLLLYSSGYSLDEAFTLSGRGGIYVYVEQTGAKVYLGNELKDTTGLFNHEVLEKNLRPDTYTVLVSHEDYWPWTKFVEVKGAEVSVRSPLLVPKIMAFKEIVKMGTVSGGSGATSSSTPRPTTSPAYTAAQALFGNSVASTTLTSKDMKLWVANNTVHAAWLGSEEGRPYYFCINKSAPCPEDIEIFTGTAPIRALDFYPNRDDALLLTMGDSVSAIEIDPTPYHNSYPVFRGTKPEVRISRGAVYIKDGSYIASIEL